MDPLTEPPPRSHAPAADIDLAALSGFDVATVPVLERGVSGFVTAAASSNPFSMSLGECCGEPGCHYRMLGLTLMPSMDELIASYARLGRFHEPPIPLDLMLKGLDVQVYYVASSKPLLVADLRSHPIHWRIPLNFHRLRDLNKASSTWELVRTLKDSLGVAALALPCREFELGEDIAVFRDHEQDMACEPVGSLMDGLPLLGSGTKTLQVLSGLLGRLGRPS